MNKRLAFLLLATLIPVSHADFSEPYGLLDEIALTKVDDFVPEGWKTIALAQGDLNQDKQTDYALVIQDTDPKHLHNIDGGDSLISTELDANPRHLLLIFGNKDKEGELSRKRIYRRFIPSPDPQNPDMADPLSYIAIHEGLLEVKFESSGAANSWEKDDLLYRFSYKPDKDRFQLINYDHRNVNRASGMFKQTSIDLENGQQIKTAGSMSSPKHRKDTEQFQTTQHWTPCEIKQPLLFSP